MSETLQTINPDQVPIVAAVPADANVFIQVAGAPLQRVTHSSLLAKLIKTDLVKTTSAILAADLAHVADSVALVISDPVPGMNGWWRKTGASGAGAWTQFETLSLTAKLAAESAAAQAIAILSSATGGAVSSVTPAVAIPAGKFVHEMADGTCVLADPNNAALWATGFAPAAIAPGETGMVAGLGLNAAVMVTTFAAEVYLDPANPGGFTTVIPDAASGAKFIQALGMAKPGVGIIFTPQARIYL